MYMYIIDIDYVNTEVYFLREYALFRLHVDNLKIRSVHVSGQRETKSYAHLFIDQQRPVGLDLVGFPRHFLLYTMLLKHQICLSCYSISITIKYFISSKNINYVDVEDIVICRYFYLS